MRILEKGDVATHALIQELVGMDSKLAAIVVDSAAGGRASEARSRARRRLNQPHWQNTRSVSVGAEVMRADGQPP